MNKISRNVLMALCLSLALTGSALAQGHGAHGAGPNAGTPGGAGGPGGAGPCADNGAWNLTTEQRASYDKIMQEYDAKVTPLRDEMWAKHTELKALSGNPKTEPGTISKLVQDMSNTRVKLRQEREVLAQRLEKELGIKSGFGRGGFHGGKGMMRGHGGGSGAHGGMGMMGGGMMGGGMGCMGGNAPDAAASDAAPAPAAK